MQVPNNGRPALNGRPAQMGGRPAGGPPGGRPGGGPPGGGAPGGRPNMATLRRAIGYVGHYRRLALLAYGALFVATAAQLVVPQLVQNIIDEVVRAYIATQVLNLPPVGQALAAQQMGLTLAELQANRQGAAAALALAMLGIAGFALLRAL